MALLSPAYSDMEFCATMRAELAEDLSQIVEGSVEVIKIMMWMPNLWSVSIKKQLHYVSLI